MVLILSLLEVKKRLGHAQIGLLQGFNSNFPTSIPAPSYAKYPRVMDSPQSLLKQLHLSFFHEGEN